MGAMLKKMTVDTREKALRVNVFERFITSLNWVAFCVSLLLSFWSRFAQWTILPPVMSTHVVKMRKYRVPSRVQTRQSLLFPREKAAKCVNISCPDEAILAVSALKSCNMREYNVPRQGNPCFFRAKKLQNARKYRVLPRQSLLFPFQKAATCAKISRVVILHIAKISRVV